MQVRLLIGDTDEDYAYLQDEELQFYLDKGHSLEKTAVWGVKRIITRLAKEVSYKIGPEQVEASDRLQHFKDILEMLQDDRADHIITAPTAVIRPACFTIGMTDNRGGGY